MKIFDWVWPLLIIVNGGLGVVAEETRPNILLCISDDQSYQHAGANGDLVVATPAFDRIAREGLRFTHAFCDAPSCGPSRSAILTGQSIWRLEEAGNIHSTLPAKFTTYAELLRDTGYSVGATGKGWGPGKLRPGSRTINPAGSLINARKLKPPFGSMSNIDYAGNFEDFLTQLADDQPFCFWLGTHEPHRDYQAGAGIASGKDPQQVIVPATLPDNDIVRSDLLDYLVEIEHFDRMVARAIASLEERGLLDNTIVVVTSDHGMPFPRAKATLYDAGTRVPLAIRWPRGIDHPGRVVDALVSLSDLAPTFLEAAGLQPPAMMTADSMLDIFRDQRVSPRDAAYVAMERHDGCRRGGKGYPCRAIRTRDYLYIYNFEPARWPAGSPNPADCARSIPYGEIDSSPTKTYMLEHSSDPDVTRFAALAWGIRPAEELYDLEQDPHQMINLASDTRYAQARRSLHERLWEHLRKTADPRVTGEPALWDRYPYYGSRTNSTWSVE